MCAHLAREMRNRGLDTAVASRTRPVLGICGGYQMLGQSIVDDVESRAGLVDGLGLLPTRVTFSGEKVLARPAESISIGEVMDALGGRIFESNFCASHSGQAAICTRSVDCSVRSLWRAVQVSVDQVLNKATLRDLLQNEEDMNSWVKSIPGANRLTLIQ